MKRNVFALLLPGLLLIFFNRPVTASNSTLIAFPNDVQPTPAFSVTAASAQRSAVLWRASELTAVRDDDDLVSYRMAGPHAIETDDPYPLQSGLVVMPWGFNGTVRVRGGHFFRLTGDGRLVADASMHTAGVYEDDFVQLGETGIFRDFAVAPLTVRPMREGADGSLWVAADLDIEIDTAEPMAHQPGSKPNRPVSTAFLPLYQSLLLNDLDDLGVVTSKTKGSYLIVTAQVNSTPLQTSGFITWKREKGYTVVVETFDSNAGPLDYNDLRALVSDAYATFDPPLEYVLLVGDENRGGDSSIPAERIDHPAEDEHDVTDWPLAFLDGSDYFPEIMIGRIPIADAQETVKAAKRTVTYEKNGGGLSLSHQYWRSATLVAANYNEGGGTPLTPVAVSEFIAEHMLEEWGFLNAYGLYWSVGGDNTNAQEIRTAIDSGVIWVTYRGWGNATGWVQPAFTIGDVEALTNYSMLPVLASFVCNTGDFGAAANGGKCFAEVWITNGTVNSPTGAVAVVAPSDLHTYTRYNNSLIAGFFGGVYEDGLYNVSAALLRAKWELYLGFPSERDHGNFVEFYYHVYHVLGDPELTCWTGRPKQLSVDIPAEVALGQGHVTATVEAPWGPLKNAYVQFIQGDNLFVGGFTDVGGVVSLPISDAVEGAIDVTITAPQFLPFQESLNVTQQANTVGVSGWSVDAGPDGLVSRDEQVNLVVTLRNGGTQSASNVNATLSFPDQDLVDIPDAEAGFGTIAPGASASNGGDPFEFQLNDLLYDDMVLEFDLEITSGDHTWQGKVWARTGRDVLRYVEYENVGGNDFAPGETASLRFKFRNEGSVDAPALDMTLHSFDEAVTGISGGVSNLALPMGEDVWIGPFDVTIDGETWRGRPVPFFMSFSDDGLSYGSIPFTVPLEGAQSTDPLGPDGYGYYAYDNTDTAWPDNVPAYTWFDLDQDPATDEHFLLADDANAQIELPFDVRYYGDLYPAGSPLTICSNGWVSLSEEQDYTVNFFRNWQIPSVIGPHVPIMPFWDDIGPQIGADHMNVYYKYDEAHGRFIIEWSDAINRWSDQVAYPAYMALVIYSPDAMLTETGDSVIEMHYQQVVNIDSNNNYASVGIERPDRSTGLEYTYGLSYPAAAAPLADGRAIRFTTNAPDELNDIPVSGVDSSLPGTFTLYPVQPNPFNSSTTISFDLPFNGEVKLSIYNLLGQEIERLIDRPMTAGHKEVVWQVNDRSLSSGMLLIRLNADGQEQWGKMMFLK